MVGLKVEEEGCRTFKSIPENLAVTSLRLCDHRPVLEVGGGGAVGGWQPL